MEEIGFSARSSLHESDAPTVTRPLSLRQIEVFRAIMMTGSISGAGRVLHVSQPAISRVLALTESRLGYLLFERIKTRLAPTAEARRLYAEVEQVYGGIQRVNDLAANLGQSGAGTLKLVSSACFGQRLVPQALASMLDGNHRLHVDYRSVTFDEFAAQFLTGQADIGISMRAPEHPNLSSEVIGEQPLVCIMPREHPLRDVDHVTPEHFASESWIGYPPGTPLASSLHTFFNGTPPCSATVEVHSPVTSCSFVQQGLGLALVDAWSVTPELQHSTVVKSVSPPVSIEIWVTYSNLTPMPLLARRFLTAVKAILGAP